MTNQSTDTRTTEEKIESVLNTWNGASGIYTLYARMQDEGHTLAEMQEHKSNHGYFYNEETEEEGELFLDGICAVELGDGNGFGGSCASEIVVFKGRHLDFVYDGEVVYPTEIIARFNEKEYKELLSQI
jgi:hypothetical protein